jgi:hypothetical protein
LRKVAYTAGQATFYCNGTLDGAVIVDADRRSMPLTRLIAAFSRANASRNVDLYSAALEQQR